MGFKKLLTAIGLGVVLLLGACSSQDSSSGESVDRVAELKEKGTVRVGFANEVPYAYEEDGQLKGASVEIAKAVFAEIGIDNVEGHLADFSQLIPGLQAGQYDVITAGMAIQPKRCENVAFAEPEMQYGEGLIVKAGNPLGLESYKDIAANPDVTVAVMEGATEVGFLLEEGVSEDQIITVADIPATFSAVQSGRADATTGTEMTVKMALQSADTDELEFVETFEQPDVEGVPSYGAAAFNLDDTELRDAFNDILEKLKEDGTVAEILERNHFSPERNMVEPGTVTTEQICKGEI